MGVLRPSSSSCPEVVRVPQCRGNHGEPRRSELDRGRCEGVHRPGDDRVRADVAPVEVGLFEEIGEPVEDWAELFLALDEATSELRDSVGVVLAEILAVEHARGVDRDVVAMVERRVAEGGLSIGAARVQHLLQHVRVDVDGP